MPNTDVLSVRADNGSEEQHSGNVRVFLQRARVSVCNRCVKRHAFWDLDEDNIANILVWSRNVTRKIAAGFIDLVIKALLFVGPVRRKNGESK
jgi:hypothetical protein